MGAAWATCRHRYCDRASPQRRGTPGGKTRGVFVAAAFSGSGMSALSAPVGRLARRGGPEAGASRLRFVREYDRIDVHDQKRVQLGHRLLGRRAQRRAPRFRGRGSADGDRSCPPTPRRARDDQRRDRGGGDSGLDREAVGVRSRRGRDRQMPPADQGVLRRRTAGHDLHPPGPVPGKALVDRGVRRGATARRSRDRAPRRARRDRPAQRRRLDPLRPGLSRNARRRRLRPFAGRLPAHEPAPGRRRSRATTTSSGRGCTWATSSGRKARPNATRS